MYKSRVPTHLEDFPAKDLQVLNRWLRARIMLLNIPTTRKAVESIMLSSIMWGPRPGGSKPHLPYKHERSKKGGRPLLSGEQ